MRTIHKWQLDVTDEQVIQMPVGCRILCARMQRETLCVWALVNPEVAKVPVRFRVVGTGHPFEDADQWSYLDTVLVEDDALVFHVFVDNTHASPKV